MNASSGSGRDPRPLVIYTKSYPYGGGETFLDAEVKALADHFAHIVVQPYVANGKPRTTPPGVAVNAPIWPTRASRIAFYLRALARPRSYALMARELRHYARSDNRRGAGVAAHVRAALKIAHWSLFRAQAETIPPIRDLIGASGEPIAYSYWGHFPALPLKTLDEAGIPTFVRFHRVDLYGEASGAIGSAATRSDYMPFHHEYGRSAATLLFVSEHGRAYFAEKYLSGAGAGRAKLAYLGVYDAGQRPAGPRATPSLTIVSCSRIAAVKRVDVIARLLNAMAQTEPVTWHHFGAGDQGVIAAALGEQKSPGLEIVLHGAVPNATLRQFYREAHVDAFINLSVSEGLPVSILEAISAGIPVVASDVNGIPEAVIPGRSGVVLSAGELADLPSLSPAALVSLLRSPEFQGLDPVSVWKERFDASETYSDLAQLLRGARSAGAPA